MSNVTMRQLIRQMHERELEELRIWRMDRGTYRCSYARCATEGCCNYFYRSYRTEKHCTDECLVNWAINQKLEQQAARDAEYSRELKAQRASESTSKARAKSELLATINKLKELKNDNTGIDSGKRRRPHRDDDNTGTLAGD